MTKRTKNNPVGKAVAVLAVLGVAGALALAAYVKFTPANHVPEEMRRTGEQAAVVPQVPKPERGRQIHVLTPNRKGTDLLLGSHPASVPDGQDPMVYAVNEFLKRSKVVTADARAIGVQIKDRIAYMDFTPAFAQSYSSFEEQELLQGITRTLGQFNSIDKVQFQVDGHPIETLGNVELDQPVAVVRPGTNGDPSATVRGGEGP